MTARIQPGGIRATGPFIWAFSRIAGRAMGTQPPAVFTTLGRTKGLFWGWLHFAGRLMPGGKLPRRQTEMIIIRVAQLRDCDYELQHHIRLGRRVGVTADDVERITEGSSAAGWAPSDGLLMKVTEQLIATKDIDDTTWTALISAFGERVAIEVLLLVGHYDMLATALKTLRLAPDGPRT